MFYKLWSENPVYLFCRMASSYLSSKNDNNDIKEQFWLSRLNETPWSTKDISLEGGVTLILNFRSHDYINFNLADKSFTVSNNI